MAFAQSFEDDDADPLAVVPLSAEQARLWRQSNPALSTVAVLGWQCMASLAVALVAWVVTGDSMALWSAVCGGGVVIIPAALFVFALKSRFAALNATTSGLVLLLGQLAKMLFSALLLLLVAKAVKDLNWLVLLISLAVTVQVYWLMLLWHPKRQIDMRV